MADVSTTFLGNTFDDIAYTIKQAGQNTTSCNRIGGHCQNSLNYGYSNETTTKTTTDFQNNTFPVSTRSSFENESYNTHTNDFITYIASLRHPGHSNNVAAGTMLSGVKAFNGNGELVTGGIPTIATNATVDANKILGYDSNTLDTTTTTNLGAPSQQYSGTVVPQGYHAQCKSYVRDLGAYDPAISNVSISSGTKTLTVPQGYYSTPKIVTITGPTNRTTAVTITNTSYNGITVGSAPTWSTSIPSGYYGGSVKARVTGPTLRGATNISMTNNNSQLQVKPTAGYYDGTAYDVTSLPDATNFTVGSLLKNVKGYNSEGKLITGNIENGTVTTTDPSASDVGKITVGAGYYAADTDYNYNTGDAQAGDILKNKTAINSTGKLIKGTIEPRTTADITLTDPTDQNTGKVSWAAGYYASGNSKEYTYSGLSNIDPYSVICNCKYIDSSKLVKTGCLKTNAVSCIYNCVATANNLYTVYIYDSKLSRPLRLIDTIDQKKYITLASNLGSSLVFKAVSSQTGAEGWLTFKCYAYPSGNCNVAINMYSPGDLMWVTICSYTNYTCIVIGGPEYSTRSYMACKIPNGSNYIYGYLYVTKEDYVVSGGLPAEDKISFACHYTQRLGVT